MRGKFFKGINFGYKEREEYLIDYRKFYDNIYGENVIVYVLFIVKVFVIYF